MIPPLVGPSSASPGARQIKVPLPALNHSRLAILIEKEAVPTLIPVLLNFLTIVPPAWPFLVSPTPPPPAPTGPDQRLRARSGAC